MKHLLSSIFLALVVSFYVVPLHAQNEQGVAKVTVMICDADGNVVAKTTTDKNGKFEFSDLTVSSYSIKIDDKDLASKFAIKEQGVKRVVTGVDDAAADGPQFYLKVDAGQGYNVKAPRDVATGQASGKRQHGIVKITKEFDSCPIAIDESGVHVTGQIYGMAINEKGLPGEKKPKPKSTK